MENGRTACFRSPKGPTTFGGRSPAGSGDSRAQLRLIAGEAQRSVVAGSPHFCAAKMEGRRRNLAQLGSGGGSKGVGTRARPIEEGGP